MSAVTESLNDYLKKFFSENRKSLLQNFPGLTLHRLRQELELFTELKGVSSSELFESPYFPYKNSPLTYFFDQLKIGYPLQYISGMAFFYRSNFKVCPDVLIPRSETEILVELANNEIQKNFRAKNCRILDVGTGSGIIGLSLLLEEFATLDVTMSDISLKALNIAKNNYFNLAFSISPKHKVHFLESDRLKNVTGEFDFILANPPYIKRNQDLNQVHQQVQKYEPELALYLNDDDYDQWFEEFFTEIFRHLKSDGLSLIEGHEDHLENLKNLALKIGFSKAEVIQDYTQRNRFLRLKK